MTLPPKILLSALNRVRPGELRPSRIAAYRHDIHSGGDLTRVTRSVIRLFTGLKYAADR